MKEIFSIGHISIYFFGVTVALGAVAGILLAAREAKRMNISEDSIFDILLFALGGGIIGARLFYVLFYDFSYYAQYPLEILFINKGGLSIHGGILGGVLAAIWRIKKHELSIWKIADMAAPALILGQAIGRIGCDVFGIPMAAPYFWGIKVNEVLVHPVQLYEFILDYLLFAYLWLRRTSSAFQGQIFVRYLVIFAAIRGGVEFFRVNPTVFGFLSVSHLLSLLAIAAGIFLHYYLKNRYPLEKGSDRPLPVQTLLVTILLMIISTVVYYAVQG